MKSTELLPKQVFEVERQQLIQLMSSLAILLERPLSAPMLNTEAIEKVTSSVGCFRLTAPYK